MKFKITQALSLLLAILITISTSLLLTSCKSKKSSLLDEEETTYSSYDDDNDDVNIDEDEDEEDEEEETTTKKEKSAKDTKWKDFLKEYEEFVDEYVVIYKKYKNDPTDMGVLSDYTDMASKATKLSDKAENVKDDIKDSDDLKEYIDTLARIQIALY